MRTGAPDIETDAQPEDHLHGDQGGHNREAARYLETTGGTRWG